MPMTPQQRRDAALKAAATKRRMKAQQQGQSWAPPPPRPQAPPQTPPPHWQQQTPPPPPPRPAAPVNGKAFGPVADIDGQRLVVTAALEHLLILHCAEEKRRHGDITPDTRAAFADYKKVLARALMPGLDQGSKNEALVALRQAVLKLVKVTF